MFEVLEGHYNSTVGDRLKFKNTFRPAVSEHWEGLPCLYLSSERRCNLFWGSRGDPSFDKRNKDDNIVMLRMVLVYPKKNAKNTNDIKY